MSVGLLSDLFIMAEIDYRRERAMAGVHARPQVYRGARRVTWPRHRDSARHARRLPVGV